MSVQAIFVLQLFMSIVVWGALAYWLFAPWLKKRSLNDALFFLIVPHAFRHMGLVFLIPGVVAQPLPGAFASPAAYGDLITGVIALLALFALRNSWSMARVLVWVFNIVGTIDLLNALRHVNVVPDFGAVWYIPTLYVPLLLVTHIMVFFWLFKKEATPNT